MSFLVLRQLCAGCAVLSFVAECRRVLVCSREFRLVFTRERALYFFEREPECVRAELGRGARPGLASFQVLTRTLWDCD